MIEFIISQRLLLHEIGHVIIALPFGYYLWKRSKSYSYLAIYFFVTVFMDIDHLFDYWRYYGFGFDPILFLGLGYFEGPGRAFVPFHAWEWIIISLVLFKKLQKIIILTCALSMLSHLIWDSLNVGSVLFYSIIYRGFEGFRIFL